MKALAAKDDEVAEKLSGSALMEEQGGCAIM